MAQAHQGAYSPDLLGVLLDLVEIHQREERKKIDQVLLSHAEGDALGLGLFFEFEDRQFLQPVRGRDLFQLLHK